MMPSTYPNQELYGGSMKVGLPPNFLDASDIRQIPDHQEVFLSRASLSSIVFEINQYQTADAVSSGSVPVSDASISAVTGEKGSDEEAAIHHLLDTVQSPDYLAPNLSSTTNTQTQRVVMKHASLAEFPAFLTSGLKIVSPVSPSQRREWESTRRANPSNDTPRVEVEADETVVFQLLVRMAEHETDLLVRVNIPLKEQRQEDATPVEESGTEVMEKIVESLSIEDFSLFG